MARNVNGVGGPRPPQGRSLYLPVEELSDQGVLIPPPRASTHVAAVLAAASLLLAGSLLLASSGPRDAVASASGGARAAIFLEAAGAPRVDAGRLCVAMDGVRLSNGGGQHSSTEGKTKEECEETCRERPKCAQAIYSSGNQGCYMFAQANSKLYSGAHHDHSAFRSILCVGSSEAVKLEMLRSQVEHMFKSSDLESIQQRWLEAERNATNLVATLTQENKMSFVHGSPGGCGYAGFLNPTGLSWDVLPLKMNDGPQGFNPYQESLAGTATQFPALLTVAASFNPETSRRYATAVAEEFVLKGSNVLLGPDVEVTRTTLSGRGFETLSGEDPFLGSELVRPYIKAVKDKGIIATVKHWLDNNQEIYRQTMTAIVGERAQHEIYMPVFQAAFEAGAGAVMCAYNKVNGEHACENSHLLKKLLRKDLGFKGYVVSDWGATHHSENAALGGLDVEMPEGKHLGKLPQLIENGTVDQSILDLKATHVLTSMYFAGHFEGRFPIDTRGPLLHIPATSDEHDAIARDTLIDGAILLKNKRSALPLSAAVRKVALIGKYCNHTNDKRFLQGSVYSGGGSGFVMTTRTINPLQGVMAHFKKRAPAVEVVYGHHGAAAEGADVAVICVAAHAEEGWDRANLTLPEAEHLVRGVRETSGGADIKVVVLAAAPGVITTEWIDNVDAALLLFEPGEQVGPAVAMLLTGEAAPGGRLPVSIPEPDEDRFKMREYPGACKNNTWCEHMKAHFSEGTLVGYRWNDAKSVPSRFPFGFGLAYTEFAFSDLQTSCSGGVATIGVKVANVGGLDGLAVPQLYVGFESLKPVHRQLRGFRKVSVPAGGETAVVFVLGDADWSYFDEAEDRWMSALAKGERITVWVGDSSAHLPLSDTLRCGGVGLMVK